MMHYQIFKNLNELIYKILTCLNNYYFALGTSKLSLLKKAGIFLFYGLTPSSKITRFYSSIDF